MSQLKYKIIIQDFINKYVEDKDDILEFIESLSEEHAGHIVVLMGMGMFIGEMAGALSKPEKMV